MSDDLVKYLKSLRLFRYAPDNVLAQIARQTETRRFVKDDVMIREGDPSDSLFIIRTGWVKVVTTGYHGQEILLNQIGPGEVLGEMSLIDQQPRSGTVIVLTPVSAIEVKYNVVMDVLDQHPQLVQSFLRDMSERMRFANAYIGEAIDWCQHIADGDYDFVVQQVEQSQSTIIGSSQSHQARANAFLSVFFKMVDSVRRREEALKQQIQQLTIQIDEVKRQQAVQDITDTEFFEQLQSTAKELRERRQNQLKNKPTDSQPPSDS